MNLTPATMRILLAIVGMMVLAVMFGCADPVGPVGGRLPTCPKQSWVYTWPDGRVTVVEVYRKTALCSVPDSTTLSHS